MSAICHVTKTGHRCNNPLRGLRAENIRFGERVQLGRYEVFYAVVHRCYIVCRADLNGDHWEFSNFNCACAKLAELGRA